MLIADPKALLDLQAAIVGVTQSLTDEEGKRVLVSTIEDRALRMAALCAVQVAVGDAVWPGDRKISLPKPKRAPGIFSEE